ncbi:MAG: shikimate kinase [Deltaproteobacteria bacterium]|nr:shikimate kinase [Deltaproteobacteria bacterium]
MNSEPVPQTRAIVLTGFMGTGKSTVGRLLAKRLGFGFLDLDELIEKEAGIPIKEIFSAHGEACFREFESRAIKRLASSELGTALVVSTGGGAVVRELNRSLLRSFGVLVCLKASPEEILRRVGNRPERPLLYGPDREDKLHALLSERQAAYMDCDLEVDTTGLRPEEVAGIIQEYLSSVKPE